MTTLLIIVHVLVCIFLVGIVLLQHGKGADIGATFGGSSQSLFGSEGPVPLLNKITTFSAIIFMGTSITLAYLSANRSTGTVMSDVKPSPPPVEQTVPAPATEPVTIPLPAAQQTETKQRQDTTAQPEAKTPEQPMKKEQQEESKEKQE
jgi:preprotein translocase subunit SecG